MPAIKILRRGKWLASLILVCILGLGLAVFSPLAEAAPVYPNSIASTGDSITRGFNTGFIPYLDAPSNSWATGTNGGVVSHYSRLLKLNPTISGKNYNYAKSGAVMADLLGQVQGINSRGGVQYVTILMGANDACASSEASMTSLDTFKSQFKAALDSLKSGSPNAKIMVLSIPNIYNLWSLFKGNSTARLVWDVFNVCQSMLVNPTSTAAADVTRRNNVLQRVKDYNAKLKEVCEAYANNCRFDNNAIFDTQFVTADVTARDYFHPSLAGQAKIAQVSWLKGFYN